MPVGFLKNMSTWNFHHCGDINLVHKLHDFRGISQDKNDNGAIFTYPQIVQVYKLTQSAEEEHENIHEWNTNHNLTSAVVYDKSLDKYVGVFDYNTIRTWTEDCTNVDETPKYMFLLPIYQILEREDNSSLIIFSNGNCISLQHGLETCKTFNGKAVMKKSTIMDVASYSRHGKEYICYVLRDEASQVHIKTCPLKENMCDCDCTNIETTKVLRTIKHGEVHVTGVQIVASGYNHPLIYFTWSDSGISKYDVVKKAWKHHNYRYMNDMFKGDVAMSCVGKNYFFFYTKCYDNKAQILVPHIEIKNSSYQFQVLEKYTKHAKLLYINDFVVLVDTEKVSVFTIEKNSNKQEKDDKFELKSCLWELLRADEYLPVFGLKESEIYHRLMNYASGCHPRDIFHPSQ